MKFDNQSATRRAALKTGFALVTAAGVAGLASRAEAQSAKAAPATVAYQTKPSSGQQCSTCSSFQPPNACALVSGVIAPTAWCELYSPKST